jgi:amino acid adenylation domain-containing protein
MLVALNATNADYARDGCVHSLVEQQAARRPDAIAVRFGDQTLTYDELDARANRLAHYLLKRSGGARKLVGVSVNRSLDMVVALLATLKAGCAYVPLDPTHPPARLRRILAEAEVAALIVDDSSADALVANTRLVIDVVRDAKKIAAESASTPPAVVVPTDLAYVIYTSGSTGAPKGVEVTHGNVVNFLASMAQRPGLRASDALLAVTTIAFDIAGLELFLPLSVGATVIIASDEDVSDGFKLRDRTMTATVMQATPASWRLLLEAGFRSSPKLKMLCGGEALPRELADRLLDGGGELWNMYGPTETTIWSSCARVLPGTEPITVGTPIANTQFYVLDSADQPVAPGIAGHLHIAGDGVARGYFKRADLTAEKFVSGPSGRRMYRTGDLARVLANGEVHVIGRNDHQIKLRGYRIELGEIEAVLEKNARLAAVAVTLREDVPGEAKLVAYYVERANTPQTPQSLRTAIADDLPKYMIPTVWVAMDALPLSPAGKIDRAALPAPTVLEPVTEASQAALTPTESALAQIWADVLRNDRLTPDDNLFALGADSLQLFAITARANAQGMRLAAKELFRYPTIATLARRLDDLG